MCYYTKNGIECLFNKINLWCSFSDLTGILAGMKLAFYEQLSVCMYMCMCEHVFLWAYLSVALALQQEKGWIHLRGPKLNDQMKQAKRMFECCNICLLSGCIIHTQ